MSLAHALHQCEDIPAWSLDDTVLLSGLWQNEVFVAHTAYCAPLRALLLDCSEPIQEVRAITMGIEDRLFVRTGGRWYKVCVGGVMDPTFTLIPCEEPV